MEQQDYQLSGKRTNNGQTTPPGWSDSLPAQPDTTPPQGPPTRAQALAVIQGGGSALQQLAEFQNQHYNILAPIDWAGQPPAGTRLSLRVEKVVVGEDTYKTEGGHALKGHALDRIAAAAGVTTVSTRRTDGRVHPHYVEFTVEVKIIDSDGVERRGIGTRTIDLREDVGGGVPGADLDEIRYAAEKANQGKGRDPRGAIIKARQYIVALCETKAHYRAIRHVCNLKGAYSEPDLDMPFIAIKIVPDPSNPIAQQMILAQMTGATQALYGAPTPIETPVVLDMAPPPAVEAPYESGPEEPPSSGPDSPPVPQSLDPQQRMMGLWSRYKAAGGTAERLQTLVQVEAGLDNVGITHATHEDVDKIVAGVESDMARMAAQRVGGGS